MCRCACVWPWSAGKGIGSPGYPGAGVAGGCKLLSVSAPNLGALTRSWGKPPNPNELSSEDVG